LKKKILFVCLGNICRSPLASAILKQLVSNAGLQDHFIIDSCGTSGNHQGEGADPRTIQNALRNGVTLHHRARKLRPEDLNSFDLILTMDQHNYREAVRLAEKDGFDSEHIRMMRSFDPLSADPQADVPDPWYGVESDFEEVFQILHCSCVSLLQSIRNSLLPLYPISY
jgi:protein-tyrosine phosphatase